MTSTWRNTDSSRIYERHVWESCSIKFRPHYRTSRNSDSKPVRYNPRGAEAEDPPSRLFYTYKNTSREDARTSVGQRSTAGILCRSCFNRSFLSTMRDSDIPHSAPPLPSARCSRFSVVSCRFHHLLPMSLTSAQPAFIDSSTQLTLHTYHGKYRDIGMNYYLFWPFS